VLLLGRRSNWDWNWKQRPSTLNRLVVRAARTESKAQLPLKSRAPEFELPEPLTGKVWRLDDFQGYPALLVMFICNHCPFVIHLKKDIVKLANEYIPSQEIARAFGAACTPEFFIFKKDGQDPFELAYNGQFDDSRPNNNKPITGRDLRLALDCVLSGKPVSFPQRPSVGCSIKWHPGITI